MQFWTKRYSDWFRMVMNDRTTTEGMNQTKIKCYRVWECGGMSGAMPLRREPVTRTRSLPFVVTSIPYKWRAWTKRICTTPARRMWLRWIIRTARNHRRWSGKFSCAWTRRWFRRGDFGRPGRRNCCATSSTACCISGVSMIAARPRAAGWSARRAGCSAKWPVTLTWANCGGRVSLNGLLTLLLKMKGKFD